jgi:hypothetical protein
MPKSKDESRIDARVRDLVLCTHLFILPASLHVLVVSFLSLVH